VMRIVFVCECLCQYVNVICVSCVYDVCHICVCVLLYNVVIHVIIFTCVIYLCERCTSVL